MHPLVISYYTPGTNYEDRASELSRSLDRLGLAHRIEPRAAKPSWVENCAQKALFIQEVRSVVRCPVLWLDADAVLRRPLHELTHASCDLAVVKRNGWDIHGGQIYFGVGPIADRLVDAWTRYCSSHPHIWDQVSLGYAWWDVSLETSVDALWLNDRLIEKISRNVVGRAIQKIMSPAAISHKQESRRSKSMQGKSQRAEFKSSDLPVWWRDAARIGKPFSLTPAQRVSLGLTP